MGLYKRDALDIFTYTSLMFEMNFQPENPTADFNNFGEHEVAVRVEDDESITSEGVIAIGPDEVVIIGRNETDKCNTNRPLSDSEIQDIRDWLTPTSYDDEFGHYRRHLASYLPGTGACLTSTDEYRRWLTSSEHGILLLKGRPGSGKSVLASMIVDELSRGHPGTPVLFSFCRQMVENGRPLDVLLRDWLSQILAYSPPLQKHLRKHKEVRKRLDRFSINDLSQSLQIALTNLPGKAFCIVDDLDDVCSGDDQFIATLANLNSESPGKVKLFVTSCHTPNIISLRLGNLLTLHPRDYVGGDIGTYVRKNLNTSISFHHENSIVEAVSARARYSFVYAKIAISLFLGAEADVQTILDALPVDLEDMYTCLLKRASEKLSLPPDVLLLILQWITHARRPLRLRELEDLTETTLYATPEKDSKFDKESFYNELGSILIILPDQTIRPIHRSFAAFLRGTTWEDGAYRRSVRLDGSTQKVHSMLALGCLAYLKAGCLDQGTSRTAVLWRRYPFFAYAIDNWGFHASQTTKTDSINSDSSDLNVSIDDFLSNDGYRSDSMKLDWVSGFTFTKAVNKWHIAARFGLIDYIRYMLQTSEEGFDKKNSGGETPLWHAAASGHTGAVRLLMKAGAEPDMPDKFGRKPIRMAAMNNHYETVQFLLEAGVSPFPEDTQFPSSWLRSRFIPEAMAGSAFDVRRQSQIFILILTDI